MQLRLEVEGGLVGFYREDTSEKLLIPSELAERLLEESQAHQQAEARAERLAQYLRDQELTQSPFNFGASAKCFLWL